MKVDRLSPPQVVELRAQLTKMLEAGIIQPSNSPYGAPVLFTPKKDCGLCLCIDFRALNHQTVKDQFLIPLAEDLFDHLGFTKINLFAGFWQIRIDPESVHKTSFQITFGQYEWLSMPMASATAPPNLAVILDIFCLPLSHSPSRVQNLISPLLSLSNLTTISSATLDEIVAAQEADPFCVQMRALLTLSLNPWTPSTPALLSPQQVPWSGQHWTQSGSVSRLPVGPTSFTRPTMPPPWGIVVWRRYMQRRPKCSTFPPCIGTSLSPPTVALATVAPQKKPATTRQQDLPNQSLFLNSPGPLWV
jgi:hypothetical protein